MPFYREALNAAKWSCLTEEGSSPARLPKATPLHVCLFPESPASLSYPRQWPNLCQYLQKVVRNNLALVPQAGL